MVQSAVVADTWLKEFEEAMKLSDDIAMRLREQDSILTSGGDPSLIMSATRRKFTVLGTCLDRLESLLQNPPEKLRMDEKELYQRQDMLMGIRYKTKQMAANFSTLVSSNRGPQLSTTVPSKKITDPTNAEISAEADKGITVVTRAVDEDSNLHSPLLGTEARQSRGCSCQLFCLIILGVSVLLLLVWIIARIL